MANPDENAAPKVHPATREILPDDPMEMTGFELPGDPDLMLRLLVEDYARMGCGSDVIMQLARDPNYQAFYGLYQLFGEDELRRRVADVISRCGVMRVSKKEAEPPPDNLVQIETPLLRTV
jgi:hypothetical protein